MTTLRDIYTFQDWLQLSMESVKLLKGTGALFINQLQCLPIPSRLKDTQIDLTILAKPLKQQPKRVLVVDVQIFAYDNLHASDRALDWKP